MTGPLVSVIVVVRNGERYLAAALESIFKQDYGPLEVLVVDDHSSDGTAGIAKSHGGVRYLPANKPGLPHVRNFGIENARSDLIAYLDHDDLWAANKLSRQVACMTERPDLLYSITNVRFFLEPGSTLRPGFKRESFEVGQAGCTAGALLAKREAFRQIGMFDPDLPVGCDQDWFARARDAQLPMHSIPEPLLYKRIHNTNLSSDVHTSGKDLLTTVARSLQRRRRSIA